jgi:SNF2 family DNA or RNA helicase
MAKRNAQEHRKRVLKERRAAEHRQVARQDAQFLFDDALDAHRAGDLPSADRCLKKALILDPGHVPALTLLAQIHDGARHHAEALGYLRRLRELTDDPAVLYNMGVVYREMGQLENSVAAMRQFLAATKNRPDPKWRRLRSSAQAACQLPQPKPLGKPAAPKPVIATPLPEPARSETPPESPRVGVQFLEAAPPAFAARATVADYFLRRRWMELRLAQNFDDLLCLSSLQGVDTYVYQQETVRRVLRHFKGRALLADEVGLGKTIEACLVLKEYWLRGLVRKALVLTPPSLVSQWKGELTEKFGLQPVSPDTAEFRRDPAQFWKDESLVVASIAMARLEAHASAIGLVAWDMVIVDEAHCLKNRASANWQLVDSLKKKFLLMLSATPVENNLIELYNLITLLKPGLLATEPAFRKSYLVPGKPKAPKNAEQLRMLLREVMIRNTRAAADVQLPRRVAATITVSPSEAEAGLYGVVSQFVASRYRRLDGTGPSALALDLIQRQAGSSPAALIRSIANGLSGKGWAKGDDRRQLEAILDLASSVRESGKGVQLGRMLAAHSGKAVVFTEFLPTLDHLKYICEEHGISYSIFSGELTRGEKDAAIARFRDQARVLLSTGAGGEGRNLQFADTIVNFDLPWNPMRIEQRVGRVHRIGQTHEVFVFNFCQEGSVEQQLLRVLHDKINMFELVVGEMDAILGSLEDGRDFGEIVMDLWVSGRESGKVEQEFDALAGRLLQAKRQHEKVKELDESLFAQDFEV